MFAFPRLREIGGTGELRPGAVNRVLSRARRPLDRAFERSAIALDGMAALSAQVDGPIADSKVARGASPRILVASLRGWSTHNAYELVIAQALRLRGAEVALLTCGGGMPACELGWARHAHPRPCDRCAWLTNSVIEVAGLSHYRLGDLLPWGKDARGAPDEPTGASAADARQDSLISVAWLLKASLLDRIPDAQELTEDFAVAADGVSSAAASDLRRVRARCRLPAQRPVRSRAANPPTRPRLRRPSANIRDRPARAARLSSPRTRPLRNTMSINFGPP